MMTFSLYQLVLLACIKVHVSACIKKRAIQAEATVHGALSLYQGQPVLRNTSTAGGHGSWCLSLYQLLPLRGSVFFDTTPPSGCQQAQAAGGLK